MRLLAALVAASVAAGGHSSQLSLRVCVHRRDAAAAAAVLNQFVRGQFLQHTTATIGAAFMRKTVRIGGWNIVLQIWVSRQQMHALRSVPMDDESTAAQCDADWTALLLLLRTRPAKSASARWRPCIFAVPRR